MFKTTKNGKILTLTEYPDVNQVINLWRHPNIPESLFERFMKYCKEAEQGKIEIKYIQHGKYGRYFSKDTTIAPSIDMMGLLRFHLFNKTEYDVDIVNCHNALLYDLIKDNTNYETTYLKQYVDNRDDIINSFSLCPDKLNEYNIENKKKCTKKDVFKSLFTILLYGGAVHTWESQFDLYEDDYKTTDFLEKYIEELSANTETLLNDKRFSQIKTDVWRENVKKCKEKFGKKYKDDKLVVNKSKYISVYLQEYERQIVDEAMEYLHNKGYCITSYNYDGFQVLKQTGFTGTSMINDLNNHIQEFQFGLDKKQTFNNIKFIIKPFKEGLDLSQIKPLKDYFNEEEYLLSVWYSYRKDAFEKYHFKCQEPLCFIKENEDDKIQFIKPTNIFPTYKHMKAKIWDNQDKCFKMKCFMDAWLCDENMRCYRSIGFYPKPLKCPDNIYNAWKEFPIEKVAYDENADTSLIHKHFDLISNGDNLLKEYLLNWFAHIVQYPAYKSRVCLVIQGLQGSGKSMIAEKLMAKIIGAEKMFITGKTDKAFGKFSDLQGKLLCILNEANGKDTFELNETLKDNITCDILQLEKKGMDILEVKDYVNYIFTTNNINAVKITEDDRRFMPFSVDNSMKNNKEYFTNLNADLENPIIMRKFYQELMDRKLDDFDLINDRPITELMNTMKDINENPLDKFITYMNDEFIPQNFTKEDADCGGYISYDNSSFYKVFEKWWKDEGRKFDSIITRTKFGAIIKSKVRHRRLGKGVVYQFEYAE
jgi:hypothetical protein